MPFCLTQYKLQPQPVTFDTKYFWVYSLKKKSDFGNS